MNLKDDIYNYLTAISELTDMIGTGNIYWNDAPTDSVNNIVYKMISNPLKDNSDNDDKWQRWRFWIKHSNKVTCRAIGDLLIDNLNRIRGSIGNSTVSYISILSDEDPLKLDDLDVYEIIQDYRINSH